MKWRNLTPKQLSALTNLLFGQARAMEDERDVLCAEHGFDIVDAVRAVGRRLDREARRREREAKDPDPGSRIWREERRKDRKTRGPAPFTTTELATPDGAKRFSNAVADAQRAGGGTIPVVMTTADVADALQTGDT